MTEQQRQLKRHMLCITLSLEESESETEGKTVLQNALVYGRGISVTEDELQRVYDMTLRDIAKEMGRE